MTDTGPPYPPLPVAGSNAIGFFEIGVSPIGTIPAATSWQAVISQYANSPILDALVADIFDWIDQTEEIDEFYDNIMNIGTAVGYGLDVWGRILQVGRVVELPGAVEYFGFEEAGAPSFSQGFAFYSGEPDTTSFTLADTPYRTLLLAKAFANICDGSIPAINKILLSLFPGRGNCYVTDGGNMTMAYTFAFPLSQVELAIVQQSGALPKPVGVAATVVQP